MIYYSSLFNTKSSAEISWNWFLLATYVSVSKISKQKNSKILGPVQELLSHPVNKFCTVVSHYNSFSNPTL